MPMGVYSKDLNKSTFKKLGYPFEVIPTAYNRESKKYN